MTRNWTFYRPVGVQIHDKAAEAKAVNNNEAVLPNKGMLFFLCDLYRIGRPLFKWELNYCRLQGGMYITWLGQIHRVRSCACILCGDKTDEMYPYSKSYCRRKHWFVRLFIAGKPRAHVILVME